MRAGGAHPFFFSLRRTHARRTAPGSAPPAVRPPPLSAFTRSHHKQIQPLLLVPLALAFHILFHTFYIPNGNLLILGTRFISELHFLD